MDKKQGTVSYMLNQYAKACKILNVNPENEGEPDLAQTIVLMLTKLGEAANTLEEYVEAEARGADPMKIKLRATDAGEVLAGKTFAAPDFRIAFRRTEEGYCKVSHVFSYPIDVLEKLLPALPSPELCESMDVKADRSLNQEGVEGGSFIGYFTITPKQTPEQHQLRHVRNHLECLRRDVCHQTRNGNTQAAKRTDQSIRLFEDYEKRLMEGRSNA